MFEHHARFHRAMIDGVIKELTGGGTGGSDQGGHKAEFLVQRLLKRTTKEAKYDYEESDYGHYADGNGSFTGSVHAHHGKKKKPPQRRPWNPSP